MPRDSGGVYSLPAGYLAVLGETIQPSQHNPPLEDIASSLTNSLPRNGAAPMVGDLAMGLHKITGLGAGSNPTDAATVSQLALIPVGAVLDFAGTATPAGWLLCFGQAVSRTTYAALFAAIGVAFGAGDGSTTFNLPDCRDRVIAGRGDMGGVAAGRLTPGMSGITSSAIANAGGSESHTLTISEIPNHDHGGSTGAAGATYDTYPASPQTVSVQGGGAALNFWQYSNTQVLYAAHQHPIPAQGGGAAHSIVQPTLIANKIIYFGA